MLYVTMKLTCRRVKITTFTACNDLSASCGMFRKMTLELELRATHIGTFNGRPGWTPQVGDPYSVGWVGLLRVGRPNPTLGNPWATQPIPPDAIATQMNNSNERPKWTTQMDDLNGRRAVDCPRAPSHKISDSLATNAGPAQPAARWPHG